MVANELPRICPLSYQDFRTLSREDAKFLQQFPASTSVRGVVGWDILAFGILLGLSGQSTQHLL
jgi:hypothetical protein